MTARLLIALAMFACASTTAAQTAAPAPSTTAFLSRADFYMSGEYLTHEDERFVWDANIGGDLDVVDYSRGRLTFFANYQVTLGEEIRAFDPNQGNYIFDGSASVRLGAAELAGVFYHQSRHLADRIKKDAVDWNMIGVRAKTAFMLGATHLDTRADFRGTIKRSFVDYRWELDGRLRADQLVRPGVGVMISAAVRHLGVDGSRNRGGQTGIRAEGGVRFDGVVAALELFAGVERRVDPYPMEFSTATWAFVGFRLASR